MENLSNAVLIVTIVAYMVILAVFVISMWKLFEKAGKPGWSCLIPFYNIIVFMDIMENHGGGYFY